MHNVDHVESSLNKIRELFIKASERIEALQVGEKIPATALAEELGSQFGLTGPQTYPVLKFLFNSYPGILVRRGAHGGLIKPGPTPEKKSKVVADQASSSEDTDSSIDDSDNLIG